MKKIVSILIMASILLGCSDNFLEEKTYGLIKPDDYFKTADDLEKTVNGLYANVIQLFRQTQDFCGVMGGDDVTSWPTKNLYLEADVFDPSDDNTAYAEIWKVCYASIKQSNVILTEIDNFVEPVGQPELLSARKERALGQAYFVRALAYYYLVRLFGEVPKITSLEVSLDVPRSSFQDVYSLIVDDLKKAEGLLPVGYVNAPHASDLEKSSYYARPTSGSAKSLLASVYLTMAGYPLKDDGYYALAAAKAKEVIDQEDLYGYELLPMDQLWKYASNINQETVFGCYYNHNVGGSHNSTMLAPLAFKPGDFGGWDDLFAELTFFNEFPEGPRKDETFLTKGRKTPEDPILEWPDFQLAHPYYKKYYDVPGFDENHLSKWVGWKSGRTTMVIRYAEVLLIYAEAQAMSGGVNDDAYDAIDRVRTRAGLPGLTRGLQAAAFRDSVIMERKWEFAGAEPNARWFDMLRTETVESATAKRDSREVALVRQPSPATYFLPIPYLEVMKNPNLAK